MKDYKNARWTKKDIAEQYKIENPNWSWEQCWKKADIIYRELNKLNNQTWKNNKMFFKYNIPFSDFGNRNNEFEEIFFDKDMF